MRYRFRMIRNVKIALFTLCSAVISASYAPEYLRGSKNRSFVELMILLLLVVLWVWLLLKLFT